MESNFDNEVNTWYREYSDFIMCSAQETAALDSYFLNAEESLVHGPHDCISAMYMCTGPADNCRSSNPAH